VASFCPFIITSIEET